MVHLNINPILLKSKRNIKGVGVQTSGILECLATYVEETELKRKCVEISGGNLLHKSQKGEDF